MTNFQYYMQKAVNEVYDGTDNEFYAICDYIENCRKCPIRFKCEGVPDREVISKWLRKEYNDTENGNVNGKSNNEKETSEASGN